MSPKLKCGIALLFLSLVGLGVYWWIHDAPRRASLDSLVRLETAVHSGSGAELLNLVVLPAAVRSRAAPEQSEFLTKALNDEISPEGLAALSQRGTYGPLKMLFPAEAESWADQAGVHPDDCVAFKLERNGLRAEVVLVKPPPRGSQIYNPDTPYRIVRLNNVKQMAESNPLTTEKTR